MKGTFEPDGPLWEAFCHRGFRADDVALYEGNWIAQNKAARSCLAAHKSACGRLPASRAGFFDVTSAASAIATSTPAPIILLADRLCARSVPTASARSWVRTLSRSFRKGRRAPPPNLAINAPSVPATAAERGYALEQEPAAWTTSSSCSGRSAPAHSQPGRSSSTQHPRRCNQAGPHR